MVAIAVSMTRWSDLTGRMAGTCFHSAAPQFIGNSIQQDTVLDHNTCQADYAHTEHDRCNRHPCYGAAQEHPITEKISVRTMNGLLIKLNCNTSIRIWPPGPWQCARNGSFPALFTLARLFDRYIGGYACFVLKSAILSPVSLFTAAVIGGSSTMDCNWIDAAYIFPQYGAWSYSYNQGGNRTQQGSIWSTGQFMSMNVGMFMISGGLLRCSSA